MRPWLVFALLMTSSGALWASPPRRSRSFPSRAGRPTTPAGYFHVVREWHTPTKGKEITMDPNGRPVFVLHAMYVGETVELTATTDQGDFSAADLAKASHALREPSNGNEIPIEPRTLNYVYQIQAHFKAQEIRVMSGYRTPTPTSSQGQHGLGRAIDFVVPGVEDANVARYAREFGFAGVGLYPVGSFVHLDARARSYFWIDRSGPGHRSRERGILLEVASRSDAAARARGDEPPASLVSFVAEALSPNAGASTGEDEDEE